MAGFVKGDVITINFPETNGTGSTQRPAMVLFDLPGNDIVLCQITKIDYRHDPNSVPIKKTADFQKGGLKLDSWVRTGKIFTMEKSLINRYCGRLTKAIVDKITQIIMDNLL